MCLTKGLKFKKFDLHIHTPGSNDFKEKDVTPEQIINAAISKELSGIAITDHQTGAWVDSVKEVGQKKGIIVFPGVELKVHGGRDGIHLIVLFDVDKSSSHVSAFLNTIKVYNHNGKPDVIANKTAVDIARELQEFDANSILILAHCLSGQGVISEMRGSQRNELFRPEWKRLIGAEANETDFTNDQKIKEHDRIIDILDGGYKVFHYKKMGVYQASDAHRLSEIGKKYSYFKVDEPITIEDIRQSLIDRDTRIRQSFEYEEFHYLRIDGLKITSGFLADQEFEFHEGLNSILGGKGSGKSLAIEFLRFALNQPPHNEELKNDHNLKLERCLKLYGEVHVAIIDESGKRYQVRRVFNPAEGNPIEIVDISDNSKKDFQIEQVFPVLFLSQNEIIKIAEDKTGASQRQFIDRFFDFYRYQQDIERLNRDLSEVDNRFADVLKAHLASRNLQSKISTYKEEIEKLGRQIKNRVFDKYSKKEKVGQAIKNQADFLDSLKESLEDTELEYIDLVPPTTSEEVIESDPAVKRAYGTTEDVIKQIVSSIKDAISKLDEKKKVIKQEYNDWKVSFGEVKAEYDKVVKQSGGTQVVLDQKRKQLIKDLSKIEKDLTKYKGKAQQITAVVTKRTEIIKKLESAYKAYFVERRDRCNYFTEHSDGSLMVTIKEREDKTAFKENLLKFKRGTWLKDEEIEIISDKISPRDFIDNIFRYHWLGRLKKEPLEKISTTTGIKFENIEKLAQHLLDEYEYKDVLALLYTSVPKDVPSISYKVGEDFRRLHELSVGQKAVALLIIELSAGNLPIVIDQPEDSLDLRTIWEDVCTKLRVSKDIRQFVFTTHNSSVAVASDTDKFTILQADANLGKVLYSGSINRPDIKKEVIDYLEGGKSTYDTKRQKYNL